MPRRCLAVIAAVMLAACEPPPARVTGAHALFVQVVDETNVLIVIQRADGSCSILNIDDGVGFWKCHGDPDGHVLAAMKALGSAPR